MSNLPVDNLDLNVVAINLKKLIFNVLYKDIKTWEEAYLLSIKAMHEKNPDEIIVVTPGWNLELSDEDKAEADRLAEYYISIREGRDNT